MLAEDGILDIHLGPEQISDVEANPSGYMEGTGSYVELDNYHQDQVILISSILMRAFIIFV